MLTILGIGTGNFETLTLQGWQLLQAAPHILLQTAEIPLAAELTARGLCYTTLDDCYEEAEDFDEWQELAIERIMADAAQDTLFCILGDLHTNALVQALPCLEDAALVPGMSFGASALALCAPELQGGNALLTAAYDFAEAEYTGAGNLVITEVDSDYLAAEISARLLRQFAPETTVLRIHHGVKTPFALGELYTAAEWDYSSMLVLPAQPLTGREGYTYADFCRIMDILLGDHGCPWDKAQTHESLRIRLIEECYEVLEAIDRQDPFMLADELGDLLMQIVIHAKIAAKHSEFDELDVSTEISRKMIRRHPNIFGGEGVGLSWEELKRKEKAQKSGEQTLRDTPASLPALMRAQKLHTKAAGFGFRWPEQAMAWEKLKEEISELAAAATGAEREEEGGDLLLAAVGLLTELGIDSETALYAACEKFTKRFAAMESAAAKEGKPLQRLTPEDWKSLWNGAKN